MHNNYKIVTSVICILTKSFCFDIILVEGQKGSREPN